MTVLDDVDAGVVDRFVELLLSMSFDDPAVRPLLELEGLRQWRPGRTHGLRPARSGGRPARLLRRRRHRSASTATRRDTRAADRRARRARVRRRRPRPRQAGAGRPRQPATTVGVRGTPSRARPTTWPRGAASRATAGTAPTTHADGVVGVRRAGPGGGCPLGRRARAPADPTPASPTRSAAAPPAGVGPRRPGCRHRAGRARARRSGSITATSCGPTGPPTLYAQAVAAQWDPDDGDRLERRRSTTTAPSRTPSCR